MHDKAIMYVCVLLWHENVNFSIKFNILHPVLDAKLKRMDPTVQCSDTAMTLKVKGVKTPHFLVDSGRFHFC